LPQISLRPRDDPITVIAGESSQIDCMVADARPAPAIIWMLGIFFLKENKKIKKRFFSQDSCNYHLLNDTHFFINYCSIKKSFYLFLFFKKGRQSLKNTNGNQMSND
jgi:hypothetical protein